MYYVHWLIVIEALKGTIKDKYYVRGRFIDKVLLLVARFFFYLADTTG